MCKIFLTKEIINNHVSEIQKKGTLSPEIYIVLGIHEFSFRVTIVYNYRQTTPKSYTKVQDISIYNNENIIMRSNTHYTSILEL